MRRIFGLLKRIKIRPTLEKIGPSVEGISIFLSLLAVSVVLLSTYATARLSPDALEIWTWFAGYTQIGIWAYFVTTFCLYALTHRNPAQYMGKFWAEFIVCVTWATFAPYVSDFVNALGSVQMLVAIGTMAHVIRLARWCIQRCREHPIAGPLVIFVGAMIVVLSSGALAMMWIEPQTYKDFEYTAYNIYMQVMGAGAELKPATQDGRRVFLLITMIAYVVHLSIVVVLARGAWRAISGEAAVEDRLLHEVTRCNGLLEARAAKDIRIKQLETDRAEQDARIKELDAERAAKAARIELLEAELDEARAAGEASQGKEPAAD